MSDSDVQRSHDPSHELLPARRQALDAIFSPQSVAVVGASEREGSVGRTLLENLLEGSLKGEVYPVNPKRERVLGERAYSSVSALPDPVDLAVIATPASTVPDVIRECASIGVKSAVIISAGFREIGEQGRALEQEILEIARASGMRVVGPNCLGVMRPPQGLNATFAAGMAGSGSVGFISQSGALMTSILDWSFQENVGFSAFVSVGSMLDVGWGDMIDYLGNDPATDSIVCYMESVGNARAFLSAAREVALRKPIIVIKAGRTQQAAAAAASHTGTLAGSDAVLDAAFRRVGVLRVDRIGDLFSMAGTLSKQPRPTGRNLTIVTNAGGPGVLSTDALVAGGGALTPLSSGTKAALDDVLPAAWSHGNPIDVLGDATPQRYAEALAIAAADDKSDGLLVILTPQAMTDDTEVARSLIASSHNLEKPLLSSWMGGTGVAESNRLLNKANIPTFDYPDEAARVFNYMWQYSYNLRALYETPSFPEASGAERLDRQEAHRIVQEAHEDGRSLLTEHESKRLLAAYGLPVTETRLAEHADEAVRQAEDIGYPVVLKLHSTTITHKTDVGGVKLNLKRPQAVERAFEEIRSRLAEREEEAAFEGVTVQPMIEHEGYELIVGSSLDRQFGPVLLFGTGGTLVEVFEDRALALPPLNSTLARRMMEQTKIHKALRGTRGRKAVDLMKLEALLVRFSQLVAEQPLIKEVDINPLLAGPHHLTALDARVVLMDQDDERPSLAIRPYPHQYEETWEARDGTSLMIRPLRPEDEPKMIRFHENLSEESVYHRYAGFLKLDRRTAHKRLAQVCTSDYDREIALSAETSAGDLIGVGRLTKLPGTGDGEFALLVVDEAQGKGLGTELLRRLVGIGRDEGLDRIVADMLAQNRPMQKVCRALDFEITGHTQDNMVKAVKRL